MSILAQVTADGAQVTIAIALFYGALSFVSPCVLPLLPGYLSLMSGYSVKDLQDGRSSAWRMAGVTLLFIAGFTVVFVGLGASATALGGFFRQYLAIGTRIAGWVVFVFGIVIAYSAISNASWLQNLMRERRMEIDTRKFGLAGPPLMGLAFGFAWTPCIGPILGAILTLAAAQETVNQGITLLLAYSAGLGIPFLLAAVFMSRAFKTMSLFKKHLRKINIASGLLLAGFGLLMINNQLGRMSGWVIDFFDAIGLDFLTSI